MICSPIKEGPRDVFVNARGQMRMVFFWGQRVREFLIGSIDSGFDQWPDDRSVLKTRAISSLPNLPIYKNREEYTIRSLVFLRPIFPSLDQVRSFPIAIEREVI